MWQQASPLQELTKYPTLTALCLGIICLGALGLICL